MLHGWPRLPIRGGDDRRPEKDQQLQERLKERAETLYSDCQWKRWEPVSVNAWRLKLYCWYRRQIAADECPSVWKIGSWDYHRKRHKILQRMRDGLPLKKWMTGFNLTEQDMENSRLFSCRCLFSAAFHPSQYAMHWIYQFYASLVSRPLCLSQKRTPQKWTPGTNISEKFGPLELFFFSKIGQNIWTPYEKIGPCGTYFSNNILDSMELIFQDSWKIRPIWNYNWKIWTPLILCDLRTNSLHS